MRLRTVHINTETGWGGGEQQTLLLVQGLVTRGHEAVLATLPDSLLAERARGAGIEILPIRAANEIDPRAIWRLAAHLRSRQPHILHMHSQHALLLGAVASFFAPPKGRIVSRRVARSIYRRHTLRLNRLKYVFGVDRTIAISHAVKHALLRDGLDEGTISIVQSGVDPEAVVKNGLSAATSTPEDVRNELGVPPQARLVASVGSLDRIKGPHLLLEAALHVVRRVDDAFFVFVGTGQLDRQLRRDTAAHGLSDRVRFAGFRHDPLRLLAAADVFVQPSVSEGLGTSILDALILKRPVVATAVGGIPEIIEHRRHGLLVDATGVPNGDERSRSISRALADGVVELLEQPDLAARLARDGRERVLRQFTSAQMVEGTLRVYREVLGESSGADQPDPVGES